MKRFLLDLLKPGSAVSTMRFMSLICCIAAIAIAIIGLYRNNPDYGGLSLLVSVFLGAAFTGKVVQKSIESKS